jgi:hypothetical protein
MIRHHALDATTIETFAREALWFCAAHSMPPSWLGWRRALSTTWHT